MGKKKSAASEDRTTQEPLPFTIEHGDCVKLLPKQPKGFANLVIADSPYNFGQPYDAYEDNKSYDEFMTWMQSWLTLVASHALADDGSLFVFVPDPWVSEIDVLCKRELKLFKRSHIVWAFTFGKASQKGFTNSHCHILYYTKRKTKFFFDETAVRVKSARELIYKDRRALAGGKQPDDTWMLLRQQMEPYMTPDTDTWLESRICGTFKERCKHVPNQLPEPIVQRIVLAASRPGDMVVDPFVGTGTAAVVAVRCGRRFWGCDVSPESVKHAIARTRKELSK